MTQAQFLVGFPILGATIGLLLRSWPRAMSTWFFSVTSLQLFLLLLFPVATVDAVTAPMVLLIAFSVCLLVLGQPAQGAISSDLFNALFYCGLGFGFLFEPEGIGRVYLMGIFALLLLTSFRSGRFSRTERAWTVGLFGFALLALAAAAVLSGATQEIALLLAYSTLFPLFPFHGAYLIILKRLPGRLPAFLALFLPVLGLSGLMPLLSGLSPTAKTVLLACAILGLISGSLRILAQTRIPDLLAQLALVFWSILWWYGVGMEAQAPPAIIFLCAAALTLCGLFLAWQVLQSRYGDLAMNQFGGLGSAMPRFAVLFSLLVAAAMGLPLFGVFSGFMEMAFSHSRNFSAAFGLVLFAWFLASWALPAWMQKTLFGPVKPDWIYRDLSGREIAALSLIVIVLIVMGIAPYRLFGLGNLPGLSSPLTDFVLWIR